MTSAMQNTVRTMLRAMTLVAVLSVSVCVAQEEAPPAPARGVVIDQVVAIVNGDLVLESDVDEEMRFQAFQPFEARQPSTSRERAIERLVDRTLILQQEKLQPEPAITDEQVNEEFSSLRKDIPACKEYKCETDAGWQKFVTDQGFTLKELAERWKERMEVLRFIEERFRSGIRITQDEIESYYQKTLLPEYERRKATPPKLDAISDRIQEILLEQQVGALLNDWLESLKAQGNVRMASSRGARP